MHLMEHPELDLSVIIVSYNVRELLRECLESVFRATRDVTCEIFVVDNSSSDGSAEMVKGEFPAVQLIENDENVGFATANNIAMRRSRGRCLLLLNPDTVVLSDSLKPVVEHIAREPRVGAVGCKLLNSDRTVQPSCYAFPTVREVFGFYLTRGRAMSGLIDVDHETSHEVDFVRGAFLALNRECLDEIGLLDEGFFVFGEETDLCYRMMQSGWRVVYLPAPVVVHHKGRSTEGVSDDAYLERIRSLIYYFRKHHGGTRVFLVRSVISLGVAARLVLRPLLRAGSRRSGRRSRSSATELTALKLALGLCR